MESPLNELAAVLRYVHNRIGMKNVRDEELEFMLRRQNILLLNVEMEISRIADMIAIDERDNKSD